VKNPPLIYFRDVILGEVCAEKDLLFAAAPSILRRICGSFFFDVIPTEGKVEEKTFGLLIQHEFGSCDSWNGRGALLRGFFASTPSIGNGESHRY
jgi:hypothetical protein